MNRRDLIRHLAGAAVVPSAFLAVPRALAVKLEATLEPPDDDCLEMRVRVATLDPISGRPLHSEFVSVDLSQIAWKGQL